MNDPVFSQTSSEPVNVNDSDCTDPDDILSTKAITGGIVSTTYPVFVAIVIFHAASITVTLRFQSLLILIEHVMTHKEETHEKAEYGAVVPVLIAIHHVVTLMLSVIVIVVLRIEDPDNKVGAAIVTLGGRTSIIYA